jgi:DNA repair protein RadA/Sms
VFGEVGLVGELRGVASPTLRLREAERHGFRAALVPQTAVDPALRIEQRGLRRLREALE